MGIDPAVADLHCNLSHSDNLHWHFWSLSS